VEAVARRGHPADCGDGFAPRRATLRPVGIDDLARRAASLAEELQAREAEAGAAMFEVERSLLMATRSLERARRALSA
jgi:hypothetical protein